MLQGHRAYGGDFKHNHYFDDKVQLSKLGTVPDLAVLKRIVDKSQLCMENQDNEDQWNLAVHYSVLELAVDTSKYGEGVRIMSV